MNEYIFESGKELAVIKVDDEKNIYIKDKLTNFQYLLLNEKLFKDRQKRLQFKIMKSKVPKLSQSELDVYITLEMAKLGYQLKSKI